MLRVSAKTTGTEIDLQGINGDADSAARGIAFGPELMALAEGLAERDADKLTRARAALVEAAGTAVMVDAAGVAANFQRMTRIADSIGIPVDNLDAEDGVAVREELGLERFQSARNSLNR